MDKKTKILEKGSLFPLLGIGVGIGLGGCVVSFVNFCSDSEIIGVSGFLKIALPAIVILQIVSLICLILLRCRDKSNKLGVTLMMVHIVIFIVEMLLVIFNMIMLDFINLMHECASCY